MGPLTWDEDGEYDRLVEHYDERDEPPRADRERDAFEDHYDEYEHTLEDE